MFASNGFQNERIEHHANDVAAYLPFHWIRLICVSVKGLKYAFKQYPEEDYNNWQIPWDKDNKSYWAAFRTDGKIERFLEKVVMQFASDQEFNPGFNICVKL